MFKWIKRLAIASAVVGASGAVVVATGAGSYLKSSGRLLRSAVKDAVPIEFEIQRAKDSLEGLVPAAQEALRDVAREEVEVASLEKEIDREKDLLAVETTKVQKLRSTLTPQLTSYSVGGREYRRQELVEELARRFESLKTAELLLRGKEDLLRNRRNALEAAVQKLEKTRLARLELASQIEALEAQYHLLQAQSSGSTFRIDDSKLSQTEAIISELKKRLSVAQRVLAREAQFVETIPVDTTKEANVVESVDAYFHRQCEPSSQGGAVAAETRI